MILKNNIHWFDHFLVPLSYENGCVLSVLGISRDIAQQKIKDDDFRHSEQRFRKFITAIGDIVWETDAHARFVQVSPEVETILGYEPDELIGHARFEFLHPDADQPKPKKVSGCC